MLESQRTRMQSVPRTRLETVLYELLIFSEGCALEYPVAAVAGVVKQRMPLRQHMHPYLMGPSRLKSAFDAGHVAEPFDHLVMRYGMFPDLRIVKHRHLQLVAWIPGDIPDDGPFVFIEVSPYYGYILPPRCLVEELKP